MCNSLDHNCGRSLETVVNKGSDAVNAATQYSYDLLGNLTSVTDALGRTTTFFYDDLGRLAEVHDPLYPTTGKATVFARDEAGNVLVKWRRNGTDTVYYYDALNRMTGAWNEGTGVTGFFEQFFYDIYGGSDERKGKKSKQG